MIKTFTKQRTIRKPIGFETKEMEGYFRLPKKAAAIAIIKKLSGTQLRLWLYLMMEDPFADLTSDGEKIYHDIPSPVEIALKIGANQETVEKDMRVLKKLGLYDYRATGWEGYNLSAAEADSEAERLKQRKKAAIHAPQGGGLNNPQSGLNNPSERLNNPQSGLNNPSERLNNPSKTSEPLPQADFKTPQTIQTYSDFIKTLSEGERERFLEFGRKKAANLPEVPELPDRWVAKYHQELFAQFTASEAAAAAVDSEANQAKQQELVARRKAAEEFLQRDQKHSDRESNCVPAPQKSAAQPQESVEATELSNQSQEGVVEPETEGKGFGVDKDLVKKLKAKHKKSNRKENTDDRSASPAPYD